MMELGQVQNVETYQGAATPPESLDLHFVPFSPGNALCRQHLSPYRRINLQLVKTLSRSFFDCLCAL